MVINDLKLNVIRVIVWKVYLMIQNDTLILFLIFCLFFSDYFIITDAEIRTSTETIIYSF